MRTGSLTLLVDSRLDRGVFVGLAVRGLCAGVGMTDEQAFEVEACVVEAVNNAIEHSYGNRPGNEVRVTLSFTEEELSIDVADRGTAMDPAVLDTARTRGDDIDPLAERGRGLIIICSLMDAVSYSSEAGVNRLRMRKSAANGSRAERG